MVCSNGIQASQIKQEDLIFCDMYSGSFAVAFASAGLVPWPDDGWQIPPPSIITSFGKSVVLKPNMKRTPPHSSFTSK